MGDILVVYLDLPEAIRPTFESAVIEGLEYPSKICFYYSLDKFRDKIVCSCLKKQLDNAIVLHFGSSDAALAVGKARQLKKNVYRPKMYTTATSNLLESCQINFATSLITGQKISNAYTSELFKSSIPNKINFWTNRQTLSDYSENLQAELAKNIDEDMIISKKRPGSNEDNVISNVEDTNTVWILTDAAVNNAWKTAIVPFFPEISKENKNVIVLSNVSDKVLTTWRFLEAVGLLQIYNPSTFSISISPNFYAQYLRLSKQLKASYSP